MNDKTMKQVENYKLKYVPQPYMEARDTPDSSWKHTQRRSQSFPVPRSKNPDAVTSYYSATTTYKPQRNNFSNPMYSKYTALHDPDVSQMQCHAKSSRDKYSNPPTTRKAHFDDELGNVEKYEEFENFTDNGEEDVEEEITGVIYTEEDREEPAEFFDKDYEEQEADDEIDDESEPSPQTHRPSRGKNEALLKQQQHQRWKSMEQKLRYQQRMAMQTHPSAARYYQSVAEHEIPEPLSEEDFVRASARSPTRRKNVDYHNWSSSKNDPDQYNDLTVQMPRRARTKPDVDRLVDTDSNRMRKCNRCGNVSTKKPESPRGCRFDDRPNIPTKGPIGDEPDEAYCGRCNPRYSAKDTIDAQTSLYAAKSRRSRDTKSPTIYDVPDQAQDKVLYDYSRTSPRYQRKSAESYPERVKRSLHTSHGTARIQSRYVE